MTKILSNKSNIDLDYPICRPSLDLDFTQEVLDPRITFTRGSIGTRVNRNRLIETVSANQPRFDYDPVTGECKGLLIEESRTNLITDTATNFNYGISQVGPTQLDIAPDGTSVLCKHDLTGVTFPFLNCRANTTLSSGNTYTMSMWLKGTTSFSASFAFIGETTNEIYANTANITTTWQRFTLTFTLVATQTASRLQVFFGRQGEAKIISIWAAQLEQGAFATSYIPRSSGAQATRSADNASMRGTNFSSWYNSSEGTVLSSVNFIENLSSSNFSSNSILYGILTNLNNRITLFGLSGSKSIVSRYVISGFTYPSFTVVISSRQNKFAHSFKTTGISLVGNGGTPSTSQTVTSTYPIVNRLEIGNQIGTFYLNGTISRLTYYPKKLKDNQLQFLTA